MKYILIRGGSRNGKSTTIDAIAKKLKPSKVWQLNSQGIFISVSVEVDIKNGTYIIEVNGVIILVVAGSPTEQDITITVLIEIALKQNFNLKILIVAMRTFELKDNFDTPKELEKLATKISEEKIYRINEDLKTSIEFKNRISKYTNLIQKEIKSYA
jgi:hypothetical protein